MMPGMAEPVLWHIPVSHYNEKVRWALDLKGVEHERRAPLPGAHLAVAAWLTRGRAWTFPVLELDGRAIADSSAILAALEERWPEPPLLPADEGERRRALALEDHFDEAAGPAVRLLAFHELRRDAQGLGDFTATLLPRALAGSGVVRAVASRGTAAYVQARYGVAPEDAAERARATILAAFDRLEAELERAGGDHLAGDRFSVADLTAAALLAPLVRPPEGPRLPEPAPALAAFTAPLRERPGGQWVLRTFARHRGAARRP
jgi:glutathione S-transferase